MKTCIIPSEVLGEFRAFVRVPKVIPCHIPAEFQDLACRQMEEQANREHQTYLLNGEFTASRWRRKLEFGQWVARKSEAQAYFVQRSRRNDGEATYTGAFAALKGCVK